MKKIKILSSLLSLVLLTQIGSTALALNSDKIETTESIDKMDTVEYQKNVSNSLNAFQTLKANKNSLNLNDYDVYIDDDGILNIMVHDDTQKQFSVGDKITTSSKTLIQYNDILEKENFNANSIIYRKVKFKKDYLLSIQSVLIEKIEDFNILSVGSGNINNQVEIVLSELTQTSNILYYLKENIDQFDNDSVVFSYSKENILEAQRSFPGRPIYNTLGGGTSGFNAKDTITGKFGIVTAAHVATKNYTLYNRNDVAIGKPTHWQYEKSMDAAFVPFNSGFEPSVSIDGNSNNAITSYVKVADIIKGMPVAKFGQTTGRTTGIINDTSYAMTINGVDFTRLVACSYTSNSGDSGGPVYLNAASNGYAKNSLVSIHKGSSGNNKVSTKAGYILATFDLKLYTK